MAGFLEYVISSNFSESSNTLTAQAVKSFLKSLQTHGFEEVSKEALEMWIVDMTLDNFKKSTRQRYFRKMSNLYREWQQDLAENPFEATREIAEMDFESGYSEASDNLNHLNSLLERERKCIDREITDVFLYLLYNIGASIDDVVALKKDDELADNPQTHDLIDEVRKEAGNRKYMFGLDRNNKRPAQVKRELISSLHRLLIQAGMTFRNGFSRDSISAMWMAAAIKSGMGFEEIRGMIKRVPVGFDSFRLIKPIEMNDRQRTRLLNRVADYLNAKATRWFVMKMRSGQNPDDIKGRLKITDRETFGSMIFFYPTHKVAQRNAKGKLEKKEVPYLSSILFFKVRSDKVASIMHHIGDLAWCYKETNAPGSPYCTISHQEMKDFQKHIGQFSPDIKMELVTLDEPLKVGTKVFINGGGTMEGYVGKIQSVKNVDGTRTYTLALSANEYATWTVNDIEEIFIEPVNHKKLAAAK